MRDQAGRRCDEKHGFQQSQVTGQRGVRQAGVAAHIGEVQQPGRAGRQQLEQVRQGVQGVHARQVAHIALEDRRDIGGKPGRAAVLGLALGCFRITTPGQTRRQVFAGWRSFRLGDGAGEEPGQEPFDRPRQFAGRKRIERNDLHAPGQRFGKAGQRHDVGRAGEQKTARLAVFVHCQLDGGEQVRGLLDFVEDDGAGEIADETGRVACREGERGGVIEGEVLGARLGGQGLGQSGLAGLARAVEQHDRGIGHGPPDGILNMTPNHGG